MLETWAYAVSIAGIPAIDLSLTAEGTATLVERGSMDTNPQVELQAQRHNIRQAIHALEDAQRGEADAMVAIESALHILRHGIKTGGRP